MKRQFGYALLEVLLAVVLIAVAVVGVIALYTPAKDNTEINNDAMELSAIGNAFSQLNSKGLIDSTQFQQSLYKSQLLPIGYFNSDGSQIITLNNAKMTFNSTAGGFSVNVPVSFSAPNLAKQLCSKVQSTYVTGDCTIDKDGSIKLTYPRN